MRRSDGIRYLVLLVCALTPLLAGMAACPPSDTDDYPPSGSSSVCGNDRKQTGEKCDGSDLNDKTCEDLGFAAGWLACKPDCDDFDRAGCGAPLDTTCGNSTREGVEACDLLDLAGETCESLGWGPGLLACRSNCGEFDVSMCGPPPSCGNGRVDGIEICDADDFDGLTCQRLGYESGDLRCASNCMAIDRSGCVEECTPDCSGRECGLDPICGASCGTCGSGTCNASGQCQSSTDGGPSCPEARDCSGRVCGPDPVCGTSCGTCSSGSCNASGQCVGTTSCTSGTARCTSDGYGYEACGVNVTTGNTEYGPRVPCQSGYACSGGVCSHGACVRSEVIFVVDRSSSMLDSQSWTWVEDATVVAGFMYDGQSALGLKMFPGGGSCTADSLLGMATGNGESIANNLDAPSTSASTPIQDALSNLTTAYGDPGPGQAVILVSDGDETCGTAAGAVQQASNLFRSGVRVYAIAVTSTANRSFLDQIAQAGGTGSSRLVTSAQTLYDTYETILTELGACPDCDGSKPSCTSSSMVRFCNGDEMVSFDCSSYSAVCGTYNSTVGARCLGGLYAQCDTDIDHYIQVCDPAQTDLFCSTDSNQCESRCPTQDLGTSTGSSVAYYSTSGTSQQQGACGGGGAPEQAFLWTAPASGNYVISTEAYSETVLYAREVNCDGYEIACNASGNGSTGTASSISLYAYAEDKVYIVVDGKTSGATVDGYLSIVSN